MKRKGMRYKGCSCVTVMAVLAALAMPVRLAAQHHRYKLVDLGTFGGPESYINPAFTFGSHHQINHRGTVVGGSATSIPTSAVNNFFVCGGLDGTVLFVNHAFEWKHGTVTDLGALPGGNNCSVATSINVLEEIVGVSEAPGVIDPVFGTHAVRGVLWKDGRIIDLGTLGGTSSSADEINGRGQVVGFALNAIPDAVSIVYFGLAGLTNGTQTRAYLWEDGVMQDLGTLGGPDAVALFVNERGEVAGFSYTNSAPNPVLPPFQPGLPTTHPFIWTRENGMKDLGSLGGTVGFVNCECGGFNNRGQLVGIATLEGDQIADPFLWDGSKLIDLFTDSIGGQPVTANDINDAGGVVGGAAFPNRPFDAFLWRNGAATDLGTVDGDGCSWARAINSRGQVVGQSFACDGSIVHSFLWENGSIVDLNKLIPRNSKMQLVDPVSINERGEIAGIGLLPGCTLAIGDTKCGHAFVLIPCDADHSNEEGCQDTGEVTTDALQNHSPLATQSISPDSAGGGLASREIAARILARFGRNRIFGIWPR